MPEGVLASVTEEASSLIWLDEPKDRLVRSPTEYLRGWLHVENSQPELTIRHAGITLPSARNPRPDLDPNVTIGFSAYIDLPTIASQVKLSPGTLRLDFFQGETSHGSIDIILGPDAVANLDEIATNRKEKRAFILQNARQEIPLKDGVLNALPSDWRYSPHIEDKADAVSAHYYGPSIHQFLNSFPQGSMFLDAGAGLRRRPVNNVVNMEIYAYPSTDILAIGQDLPFKDNTFDGILSLAVLEHVDDPFRCADELLRVLKPGGRVFVMIPFLQAEHGYPSHFFNCTRFGVRKLFEKASVQKQWLDKSNHPIFTLNQILGLYSTGLPMDVRQRFLNTKIGELLETEPEKYYDQSHEFVSALNEDASWTLAWGTTTIFRKG